MSSAIFEKGFLLAISESVNNLSLGRPERTYVCAFLPFSKRSSCHVVFMWMHNDEIHDRLNIPEPKIVDSFGFTTELQLYSVRLCNLIMDRFIWIFYGKKWKESLLAKNRPNSTQNKKRKRGALSEFFSKFGAPGSPSRPPNPNLKDKIVDDPICGYKSVCMMLTWFDFFKRFKVILKQRFEL